MPTYSLLDFHAPADADAAPAIQKAIDAAHAAGGGTVVVPAGRTFVTGTVTLKPNTHLHLEPGSQLLGSLDPAAYRNWLMIEAFDADNIAVTGTGTIDGRGSMFKHSDAGHIYRMPNVRPRLVGLFGCRNVRFDSVILKDSANWGLHMTACEDVVIHGISILNDLKLPNCDGIDPDHCRNVRISDCYIQAGDDCIVLKATKGKMPGAMARYESGPCENITVSNCVMVSTSCAVKLGTETFADIRNVVVTGCVIRNSARGLGLFLRDTGNFENILFANCTVETRLFHDDWWGKAEPIYVTAVNRTPETKIGTIRNVRFSNILCRSENGVFLSGCDKSMLENITLEGIDIELYKRAGSKYRGGVQDRRPGIFGVADHPTAGIYVQQAREVTVRNSAVRWADRNADLSYALEAHQAPGLRLENFRGENAHAGRPAQLVDDVITQFTERLQQKD